MLEEELYNEGEELARIAVSSGMAIDQLRKVYDMVKVRPLIEPVPLPYVHAYIKRQMFRVRGRSAFKRILNLLDKYGDKRELIAKILEYTLLLYEPYRNKPVLDLIESAEPLIRGILRKRNLKLADIFGKLFGVNFIELRIKIDGYCHEKGPLIAEIQRALRGIRKFSNFRMRVRIE